MDKHQPSLPLNPDSRVLVVGLGKTGLSCARYLAGLGLRVAVTDSRTTPPGLDELKAELPDIALFLGGFADDIFANADLLVVSPGVSVKTPQIAAAAARGVAVVGDIELFARAAHAPIVAITGSNGKSTVTTLLGEMAQECGINVRVGGNLGEPALDLLDESAQLYVLELSSFQLETTYSLNAAATVVLNISEDHMDRYNSLADYAGAKAKVFSQSQICVLNLDDPLVEAMACAGKRQYFSLRASTDADCFNLAQQGDRWMLRKGSEPLLAVDQLKLAGLHNIANVLAALALGNAVQLPMACMLSAASTFRGLSHRTQFVAERNDVRWYDDSKGTNVGATLAALRGLADADRANVILIAGGQGKGADFTELGQALDGLAKAVVLIGEDAPLIEQALSHNMTRVHANSMVDAVQKAAELAGAGDVVLLSPACASFDMFRNYEHRGEVFAEAVRQCLK